MVTITPIITTVMVHLYTVETPRGWTYPKDMQGKYQFEIFATNKYKGVSFH